MVWGARCGLGRMTQKAEERREYKGRRLASSAAHTMLRRLGAVLIVGLLALALGVNGEAAPCASVLKAGKFRRGEAESAVVKRCEEDSTSTATSTTTSTTTTAPPLSGALIAGGVSQGSARPSPQRDWWELVLPKNQQLNVQLSWSQSANADFDLTVYQSVGFKLYGKFLGELGPVSGPIGYIASSRAFSKTPPEAVVLNGNSQADTTVYVAVEAFGISGTDDYIDYTLSTQRLSQ